MKAYTEEVAEAAKEAVELLESIPRKVGGTELRSIRVYLNSEVDPEKVAKYIEKFYPMYKCHTKTGKKSCVSVGYKGYL